MIDTLHRARRPGAHAALSLAVAFVLALLLGACGSSGAKLNIGAPTNAPGGSTTVAPAGAVTVRNADNGRIVAVHTGAVVRLVLGSTYWQVTGVDRPGVLRAAGAPVQQAGTCPPGVGCGTVSVSYTAIASGTVHLRASRETCGEAMRCQPPTNRYAVTVIVSP